MGAALLTGREAARLLLDRARERARDLPPEAPPAVCVVRAGDDPASRQYVGAIRRAARHAGVQVSVDQLPGDIGLPGFLEHVERVGRRSDVDGVQVQKPIPSGVHTSLVLECIPPEKDIEGLHPDNAGLLLLDRPRFIPCTAEAVLWLLDHHGVEIEGRRGVVVGRSDIVGKPLAVLLLARHATVTVCHRATADLADEVARAELVVAATGIPEMIRASWIAPGAVVVDVGHHQLPDGSQVGDVERGAEDRASAITPVPGGVGPITVACLISNAVEAALHLRGGGLASERRVHRGGRGRRWSDR
jgi:methylenetetrahydrofolate dehydrogenase (NADP+)/methenyltetrahydrofolate cyclohydrolase